MSAEPSQKFNFTAAALSHPGAVRTLNEDSYVSRTDVGMWAVADGVGGLDAGDVASRMLVEALADVEASTNGDSFLEAVESAIQRVNTAMIETSESSGCRMGSTVACVVARGGHISCVWVGDSRIYLLREGALRRLTRDHSLVQDLLDAGKIKTEEAANHARRNVITRAVGARATLDIAIVHEPVQAGDRFLICSDELTGVLTDKEIEAYLAGNGIDACAQRLMDLALERRASDNVTLIIIEAEADSAGESTIRRSLT